jgi:drug/metabolite transporter (DMT)-like permease
MAKTHRLSETTSVNKNSTVIASKLGRRLALGILLITSAFLCAAIMSALSKEASGIPALLILFMQYAISFVIFVPATLRQGILQLKTEQLVLQIFRSVAGSICQLLFFVAVRSIPLLVAVLLSNAAPLFIPIVVYIWFRKAVQPLVWISLFIGLFGIVLIIRPGPAMFHSPSALIALAAGCFSALALVATNRLAETEPPIRILVYNFGISTLLLFPLCIVSWKPLAARQWLLLIGIGISYAAAQYLIILAYRHASAIELSPFNYAVVIFSGLLDWWLFGSLPGPSSIAGTILICAGGILSIESGHIEGLGHAFGYGHWKFRWRLRHSLTARPAGALQPRS